jgi:hypothetical protein
MSGGHFDYNQFRITEIAEAIKTLIDENKNGEIVDSYDMNALIYWLDETRDPNLDWERLKANSPNRVSPRCKELATFLSENRNVSHTEESFKKVGLLEKLKEHLSYTIAESGEIVFRKFRSDENPYRDVFKKPKNGARPYSGKTINEFKKAYKLLEKASIYVQRIDWLVCGDDDEFSFHERLKEELEELSRKI